MRTSDEQPLAATDWTGAAAAAADEPVSTVWGEITVRDVLRAKREARGLDLSSSEEVAATTARSRVHTVGEGVSVWDALCKMVDSKLTFLVVTAADGRVVGIVSERHVLQTVA